VPQGNIIRCWVQHTPWLGLNRAPFLDPIGRQLTMLLYVDFGRLLRARKRSSAGGEPTATLPAGDRVVGSAGCAPHAWFAAGIVARRSVEQYPITSRRDRLAALSPHEHFINGLR
jgi:hypothetical protein